MIDLIITYIAGHWWASALLSVFYIVYEVLIRRMPTNSPYYSFVHMIGKAIKFIGKIVIKLIGENISKKLETDKNGKPTFDKKGKLKRRSFN